MDAAKKSKYDNYTVDDIYNLPNGKRAELIDGKLYMMASPSRVHQDIIIDLSYLKRFICDRNKLTEEGCKGAPD